MGHWKERDEVVASTDVGSGVLGSPVPEGTRGEVVETRTGLFDSYATVTFDNGYTEEVKTDDLKRHTWW